MLLGYAGATALHLGILVSIFPLIPFLFHPPILHQGIAGLVLGEGLQVKSTRPLLL